MRRLLKALGILGLVALGFGLGALYSALKPAPLVLQQDAIVAGTTSSSVHSSLQANYLDITPQDEVISTVFIFYPGGLVRPQAYEWLGVALAPLGVRTIIAVMPLDLAVMAPNRADEILEGLETSPNNIVIGGHSLGGAMAARYALKKPDKVDGLILMGAFSANSDDLSENDIVTLVLAAENDGLATLAEVQEGMERLPDDATLEIIRGAVHSFFGRYGPQNKDGLPTVSRATAEATITDVLKAYFLALP